MKPVKLQKLSCGLHYGRVENGPCSKCASGVLRRDPKTQQWDGMPWIAALHPPEYDSIQERAIRAARGH